MKIDELIEHLETDAEWAFANEWESPICLSDDINDALTILRTIAIAPCQVGLLESRCQRPDNYSW